MNKIEHIAIPHTIPFSGITIIALKRKKHIWKFWLPTKLYLSQDTWETPRWLGMFGIKVISTFYKMLPSSTFPDSCLHLHYEKKISLFLKAQPRSCQNQLDSCSTAQNLAMWLESDATFPADNLISMEEGENDLVIHFSLIYYFN